MKVSKVVLIVVALHVLVIGGIFVFEGCSRVKSPAPQLAENESQPGATTPAPVPVSDTNLTANALPAPAPVPAPVAPVSPAPAPVAPVPAAEAKTYVVKKGDSLYKIAKAEKVTIEQLAKANNLTKTSLLKVGQKLTIPAALAKTEPAPTPSSTVAAATSTPSAPTAGNVYEVKSGDSLWKIAKNNSTTVAAIKQANNLTKDTLKVGQKLTIPAKATAPAATATVTTTALTTPTGGQRVYVVADGDTLPGIAAKFGVKVEDLIRANKLNPATPMRVDDKLIIPAPAPAASGPAVIAPSLIAN